MAINKSVNVQLEYLTTLFENFSAPHGERKFCPGLPGGCKEKKPDFKRKKSQLLNKLAKKKSQTLKLLHKNLA